jgi:hypothetical protein
MYNENIDKKGWLMANNQESNKTTIAGEVRKNIHLTSALSRNIISEFVSSSKTLKARRQKEYAVDPEMSRDEFEKSFRNFRIQVQIYQIVFLMALMMALTKFGGLLTEVVGLYAFLMYITYIRDIHRGRLLLRRWSLANTKIPLKWGQFLQIVKKKPKYLIPIIK